MSGSVFCTPSGVFSLNGLKLLPGMTVGAGEAVALANLAAPVAGVPPAFDLLARIDEFACPPKR